MKCNSCVFRILRLIPIVMAFGGTGRRRQENRMNRNPTTSALVITAHSGTAPVHGVLWSLALCMLLPSLSLSIANVALPTLAEAWGASFGGVQWVVLAYLLAITTLVVGWGRLGDRLGRRQVLATGLAVFILGSAASALAPSLTWLVAARAIQGLGAAALMALTVAMVGDAVPRARAGQAMGLLGTMSAVGTALGPSLGGMLLETFGWRAVFWVIVPLGAVALVLVWRRLPVTRPSASAAGAPFDAAGMLWLALALGCYAASMSGGWSPATPMTLALWLAAAVAGFVFVRVEARAPAPLVPLSMLRDQATALTNHAIVSMVMMATLVVGPFHLGRALGLPMTWVGLAMSVGPVVSAFAGVPAGRLVDRWGSPIAVVVGLAGMAMASVALAVAPLAWGVVGYGLPLAMLTASYALFQAANQTGVMASLCAEQRGVGSGLLTLARHLGFITGTAAMGSWFALSVGSPALNLAAPSAVATGTRHTFLAAAVLLFFATLWAARGLRVHPKASSHRAAM
ncbi:MFS transporter [Ideonella sp. DXS29W]|uniref:MFS transporter n=1 Tax=Ideonella lacteola TaxID=2984193 RepID=A0ABU9BLS9_9BURK